MTWQRIDENTYIDDTLVTCAEYQLFIDEMRERGWYHQPDQWSSYQFPSGQARAPIIGVRSRDTETFCHWLNNREEARWYFRPPTATEVEQYPLIYPNQIPLGYWIGTFVTSLFENVAFAWACSTSNNPRNLEINRLFNRALGLNCPIPINSGFDLTLSLSRALDITGDINFKFAGAISDANLYRPTETLSKNLNRDFYRGLSHDHNRDLDSSIDLVINIAYSLAHFRVRDHSRSYSHHRSETLTRVLYLLFDIFTLRERIEGRSPAFEGIRLVKERIR